MDDRDKALEEEHKGSLHSPPQRDGDYAEIAEEEQLWRRRGGIVSSRPPEEQQGEEDLSRRNASLTSSPVAKRVNFSPLSSPRIGQRGASLSPPCSSSSRNRPNNNNNNNNNNNSLKNLIPKLSFKNKNSNMDIEKAAGLAFGASSPSSGNGRERSTAWTLSNILTETESLPVTPIAHSNPGSTHGRYVVASTKKGSALPIHRSRSVPAFNKDGSLRPSGVFRVILTPNMTPTRNINKLNDTSVDDGGEDVPEEEAVCRICLVELGEDSEAFKMECLCRGELALAHKECTIKWFTIKGNRTCDVCKQEVQNLPVTLLRMQDSQVGATEATTHYSVWQDVPVLVIVSMLAYFCFLEQLLLAKMKSGAIAISLPFSCVFGLLASMMSTTMVKKKYVWIYGTVQFGLVVLFSHIFVLLVHMQPVVSILLATLVGFGLTMSGTTGIVQFSKWRRRRRTAEPPSSSQVDPPPVQSISGS
ncbi:uncharacterized protein LOC108860514 [Raphanus sativus]|uniref:Uncharacterized protein LOC108860514 n=1 Tax=Raphanus sativus TaxID=3726 RepID=A0A6J0NZR4_RAPSA|nr:uncharacterized protein LOC108860514 [Raphanus sativus]